MCGEAVWIVTLEGLLGVKDSYSNLWLINSTFFRGSILGHCLFDARIRELELTLITQGAVD